MQYFSFLCPVYVFRHWEDKGRGPAQSHSCPRPVRGPRKAAHAGPEMHSKAAAQSPRGPAAACPLAICKPHVFERPAPSPHHRTASHVPSAPGPGSALPPSKATPGTHTAQSPGPASGVPAAHLPFAVVPELQRAGRQGGQTHIPGVSLEACLLSLRPLLLLSSLEQSQSRTPQPLPRAGAQHSLGSRDLRTPPGTVRGPQVFTGQGQAAELSPPLLSGR